MSEKLTSQVRSIIREQILSELSYYGLNRNEWTCSIVYQPNLVSKWSDKLNREVVVVEHRGCAVAYCHNKKTKCLLTFGNIYFSETGEILQRDNPVFD